MTIPFPPRQTRLATSEEEAALNAIATPRNPMADFFSRACWCGRTKPERYAVCGHCYRKLTREQRGTLQQKFGQGFEQAYFDVLAVLRKIVRPLHVVPRRPA